MERQIEAKFDGVCMECGGDILRGEAALWTVGGGVRHTCCPDIFGDFD